MTESISQVSEEDLARIQKGVTEAELRTAAEIVPVIASESGRYDRAEDFVGVVMALAAVAITWVCWPPHVEEVGAWDASRPGWQLLAFLAAMILGFFAGIWLATRWSFLRRLATPSEEMEEDVLERACFIFHMLHLRKTRGQNALLIYVSLYEHRAVILADQGILAVLAQEGVDDLCRLLTERMSKDSLADAMEATIAEAGRRLTGLLPRPDDDTNELPDKVILLP